MNFKAMRRYATPLAFTMLLACDSFREDFIQPGKQVAFSNTEYYILPGTSAIIDLKSVVKQSFPNVILIISHNPVRGELSRLDTLLLRYRPNVDFIDGIDQFSFSVMSNGAVLKTETLKIIVKQSKDELPCALYAIHDKVSVKSGSSVSIRFLENDRLCGLNNSTVAVSIYSNPSFGGVRFDRDSILVYTPGPEYSGYDELIYKLKASSGEIISYGLITVTHQANIQILKRPPGNTIFFIDENTGFTAGNSIYKTSDGGSHWNKLSGPVDTYGHFTEVQFIDADHGFAGYSGSSFPETNDSGYFLRTSDGGGSWSQGSFDYPISSVFFTSPTTGFVAYSRELVNGSVIGISKTKDGGATWKEVLSFTGDFAVLRIRFADSQTGYAYYYDDLYKTTDGGESWKRSDQDGYISSLAIASENIIIAVSPEDDMGLINFSSIYRSTDGLLWKPVAYFQHQTSAIAFSRSGEIGFAVGSIIPSTMNDPLSVPLSIVKTKDWGATWQSADIEQPLVGEALEITVPSNEVAYFLCSDKLIKYTQY